MTNDQRPNLGILVTHPIQYLAPLYRALTKRTELHTKVYFLSDFGAHPGKDPEFGKSFAWDTPVLEGYEYELLSSRRVLPSRDWTSRVSRGLVKVFRRDRIDAVLLSGYQRPIYWQGYFTARALGLPVILRAEANDSCQDRSPLKRWARSLFLSRWYRSLSAINVIGMRAREHYLAHGVPVSRLFESPYSVDNDFFRGEYERVPEQGATRRELGLQEADLIVLFCGKLVPKKDPLAMMRAAAMLAEPTRFAFLVVGEGELRKEMECAAAGIPGVTVRFMGFQNQSQISRYYRAADVLVLPSVHGETWGLVVNEAMNFGLPIIVSDRVGCAADLVIPGQTGQVFARGDATGLKAALEDFLRNPAKRKAYGENARVKVQEFSLERAADGIVAAVRYSCLPNIKS